MISDNLYCLVNKQRKTLFVLIDDAHLLEMAVLRKPRLLVAQFPRKITWCCSDNAIYCIISHSISATLKPLNNDEMERYIVKELEAARMSINTFDPAAIELIYAVPCKVT